MPQRARALLPWPRRRRRAHLCRAAQRCAGPRDDAPTPAMLAPPPGAVDSFPHHDRGDSEHPSRWRERWLRRRLAKRRKPDALRQLRGVHHGRADRDDGRHGVAHGIWWAQAKRLAALSDRVVLAVRPPPTRGGLEPATLADGGRVVSYYRCTTRTVRVEW